MPRGGGRGASWLLAMVGLCMLGLTARGAAHAQEPPSPPAGRGSIVATVLDAATARPINGATVQVVGNDALQARSDLDGKATLYAPPGTYQLRISAPLYAQTSLQSVVVTEGKSTTASASLRPRIGSGVEVVEVTADVTAATEATQLLKRKMAPTVSDSLGAETISKSPDSSAAEVVTRVPAVTIRDDKFIIVRGLGERYSSALLNGSRLPSTDPNRRIVPLDIFPANFIESLNIIKTYTPDLPGDFTGGLVDIAIADPPAQLTYGLSTSLKFNTETSFQDFESYRGYTEDWFALGDNPRELPATFEEIFPNTQQSFSPSTTEMRTLVSSLPNNWNITSTTAPPSFSVDGFVGDTWGPFGYSLSAAYGYDFSVHRDEVINGFQNDSEIADSQEGELFIYNRSTFESQLGAVLATQYKFSNDHKVLGRGLVNRQGIDEVLNGRGINNRSNGDLELFPTSSIYTANQLGMGQLEGKHHFSLFDVDWRASWAPSQQRQPDGKYYIYNRNVLDTGPPELGIVSSSSVASPLRNFLTLDEFLQDYYVDGTVPFKTRLPFTDVWSGLPAQLKTGLNYMLRERTLDFQQYRIEGISTADQYFDLTQSPESLLVPSNFSSEGPILFNRLVQEEFTADQEIAAAYAMLELPIVRDRLRIIGGARLEYSYIQTVGDVRGVGFDIKTIINDLDPLPGVSLVYTPREDMNVRAAFSQTVSRPEFRELTPTQFTALPGQRILAGNPALETAEITNYDLRWEWFFSPLELLSASFFYKELTNPIELVTATSTSSLLDLYVNYKDATLWGVEIEARKDFNFAVPYARKVSFLQPIASNLGDLQIVINASIIESETANEFDTPAGYTAAPVPGTKPLQGQSPYVINAALEYEHYRWGVFRLLYNTVGSTIISKGTDLQPDTPGGVVPDIEQEPRHALDLVWLADVTLFDTPLSTKFAVENILNDDYVQTQGPRTTNEYRTGVTFAVGLSYSF